MAEEATIVVREQTGVNAGRVHMLRIGSHVIGRDPAATIQLASTDVSRQHALLEVASDAITISDLGSKNGTLVNGSRIQGPTPLRKGDQIKLGDHLVTVQFGLEEEPEEDFQAVGTRVFSLRTLQEGVMRAPSSAEELVRKNRVLTVLSGAAAA